MGQASGELKDGPIFFRRQCTYASLLLSDGISSVHTSQIPHSLAPQAHPAEMKEAQLIGIAPLSEEWCRRGDSSGCEKINAFNR
jgi:hypothetical protein